MAEALRAAPSAETTGFRSRAAGRWLPRQMRQHASSLHLLLDRPHLDRFEFNAAPRARHSVSVHF
ncbi:hypothetical protein A6V36_22440 [Paraburkholderia ginsengiterrae]|uniref:Uncharacterized protein n=1 Tax=Paraburkholderia ginsengiterrae TaxID=1462993 RepID=A0A1A9N383_9BURK|nr:hypothetical protein A6V37_32025 [Paraburkholderia ginsengiterrae]OAJ61901.1 hypothetical protein A6V36_22440 [Paraburkholderia ginsengiterrae]